VSVSSVTPFGSWGRAVLQLLLAYDGMPEDPDEALARVGSTFDYTPDLPWYIRIDKVFQRTSRLEGQFTFDIEVFGPADTSDAESVSSGIEALVLGYPHVVEVDGVKFVFDTVSQNSGPTELPWEDEAVTRLGATYVITARRR
jgi:hypothetical protein